MRRPTMNDTRAKENETLSRPLTSHRQPALPINSAAVADIPDRSGNFRGRGASVAGSCYCNQRQGRWSGTACRTVRYSRGRTPMGTGHEGPDHSNRQIHRHPRLERPNETWRPVPAAFSPALLAILPAAALNPASLHPVVSSAKIPVMREGGSDTNELPGAGNAAAPT